MGHTSGPSHKGHRVAVGSAATPALRYPSDVDWVRNWRRGMEALQRPTRSLVAQKDGRERQDKNCLARPAPAACVESPVRPMAPCFRPSPRPAIALSTPIRQVLFSATGMPESQEEQLPLERPAAHTYPAASLA